LQSYCSYWSALKKSFNKSCLKEFTQAFSNRIKPCLDTTYVEWMWQEEKNGISPLKIVIKCVKEEVFSEGKSVGTIVTLYLRECSNGIVSTEYLFDTVTSRSGTTNFSWVVMEIGPELDIRCAQRINISMDFQ